MHQPDQTGRRGPRGEKGQIKSKVKSKGGSKEKTRGLPLARRVLKLCERPVGTGFRY